MLQASYFRDHGISSVTKDKLVSFLMRKLRLSLNDYLIIIDYLNERLKEVSGKGAFGVVYDITNLCNLNCDHCAVNAILTRTPKEKLRFETSTEEALTILEKIREYVSLKRFKRTSLVFGGGEPTLRADFRDVVRHAYRLFGKEGVGFCTNGTTVSVDDLLALEKYLSFMQISIDGPEAYHNQWRDPKKRSLITNPFQKSIAVVSEAVKHKNLRRILEVSSIVTKDNLDLLADFIKFLEELGLKNYSIHRAMPVGRMALHLDKVPDMHDYLKLLLTIARIRKVSSMHIHLHHSLESIYSALLIGKDIHQADLPMSSGRHSIGVDAKGNVYFDPWCFVVPFNKLVAGNLLERDVKLWEIMESKGSVIRLADEITKKKTRCKQCLVDCSGGMRLNAMAYYVCKLVGEIRIDVSESHLLAGLSQIDPACPLFED